MKRDERYQPNQPYLEKVSARIGRAVMHFYFNRLANGALNFHADELRNWVIAEVAIAAPASADRILRDLRQRGQLNYVLVSRTKSLYQFVRLPQQRELFESRRVG